MTTFLWWLLGLGMGITVTIVLLQRATKRESGWQPIETAPKDRSYYADLIVTFSDGDQCRQTDMWFNHEKQAWQRDHTSDANPVLIYADKDARITHWMLAPTLSKIEGDSE